MVFQYVAKCIDLALFTRQLDDHRLAIDIDDLRTEDLNDIHNIRSGRRACFDLDHNKLTLDRVKLRQIDDLDNINKLVELIDTTLQEWREKGTLESETIDLLSVNKLADILSLPVFKALNGAKVYKERQFLVSLPLERIPALRERALADGHETILSEELLFQGAIDLLAVFKDGKARIIDYKFSVKNQAELKEKYTAQLDLYKKATSRILKIGESQIECSIVNLLRGFEVSID